MLCCRLTGFLEQERGYSHGGKNISRRQRKCCIISTENRITESLVINDICSGKARRFPQASLLFLLLTLRGVPAVAGFLKDYDRTVRGTLDCWRIEEAEEMLFYC